MNSIPNPLHQAVEAIITVLSPKLEGKIILPDVDTLPNELQVLCRDVACRWNSEMPSDGLTKHLTMIRQSVERHKLTLPPMIVTGGEWETNSATT